MRKLFFVGTLLAALTTQSFAEDCKPLQRYGKIGFEPDETAHIYLPTTIAGYSTKVMLDTGAYWGVVREDLIAHLNLPTRTNYNLNLFDASGKKIDKSVVVPEFKLGALSFGAAEFFVSSIFSEGPMNELAGVVGQNLFAQVDLEIDNAGKSISLYSQDHCDGEGVHWADEAVILEYKRDNAKRTNNASRIKRDIDKNQIDEPVVSAELQGEPVTVLFDTGATSTAMDWEHARRVFKLTPETPGVVPAGSVTVGSGGRVETYKYTFKELVISGIRFENVPVRLGTFGRTAKLILGMNEMKHLHLYFAFKEGRIYVTAANAGRTPAK